MKSLPIPQSGDFDHWRIPAWSMSTSDLDKACDWLGGVGCAKREELRAAVMAEAGLYLRRTKQEVATPSLSRQKAQLAKVSDAAERLLLEVKKLAPGLDAEFALLYELERQSRDAGISGASCLGNPRNIDDVLGFIARLRDAAIDGSRFIDNRSGPKSTWSLHLFVHGLCRLYQQITGKQPTHNPYDKTRYTGEPQSEAGRFVEFLVQLVDPKVTSTQISTAMSHVVTARRR